ncbi:MAG: ATP-binding protein [Thermotaleaceae bacterium]
MCPKEQEQRNMPKGHNLLTQLSLNADIHGLKILKYYCHEIAEMQLRNEDRIFEYILCMDEIFINCITHGYGNKGGVVNVQFTLDEKYLLTSIQDFGVGISTDYLKEIPDMPPDPLCEYGRGLFLVNHLSNRLEIQKTKEGGTLVYVYFERMC